MSNLKFFNEFINESQAKKAKKYFTFSVVLEWYRKNKQKIADMLGCSIDTLASEDLLMDQSYQLVNYVINPQSQGNEGRENLEISGFSSFKKLEKNLIHDILHNIYQVQNKEFDKSLERIEYSESEIFEEIEVLSIEESFMKFMNIKYVKSDFINSNINLLASYLMMSILKYDPTRIEKILDNEVEPYFEIYGKKYNTEGTPFENFFKLFKNDKADTKFGNIDNSDDFKEYMIHLINVGKGIDESGGDRAMYPNSDYFGMESFNDLSDYDKNNFIDDNFEIKDRYILIKEDDILDIKELKDKGIKLRSIDENTTQLKLFKDYEEEDSNDRYHLKVLPFKNEFLDEDGYIDMEKWFDFLENKFEIEFYKTEGDNRYLGIVFNRRDNNEYSLLDNIEFYDYISNEYDSYSEPLNTNTKFIDFDSYRKLSFKEVSERLFNNSEARAIMRRKFRTNDVIKNNTLIGNLDVWRKSWGSEEIKTKSKVDKYTDFSASDFKAEKSISKNILTDNGKRLIYLLNDLRGYFIKNVDKIKEKFKEKSKKFGEEDIQKYRNINLKSLKELLDIVSKIDVNIDKINIDFKLHYNWRVGSGLNGLELENNDNINGIVEFYNNFQEIKNFKDKVKTKEDVEFLMNYVNEKGMLRTPKDFIKFKTFVTKLRKHELLLDQYPFKDSLLKLSKQFENKFKIDIEQEILNSLKTDENTALSIIKNILNKYLPYLKIKNIIINEISYYDISFSVEI